MIRHARPDDGQGSLCFDAPPASHRDDPCTSKDAEAAVTCSGQRERNKRRVLGVVRAHPGLTALEYHERHLSDMEKQEPRRRLTDLKNVGLVLRGESRRRAPGVKAECTWWPKAI